MPHVDRAVCRSVPVRQLNGIDAGTVGGEGRHPAVAVPLHEVHGLVADGEHRFVGVSHHLDGLPRGARGLLQMQHGHAAEAVQLLFQAVGGGEVGNQDAPRAPFAGQQLPGASGMVRRQGRCGQQVEVERLDAMPVEPVRGRFLVAEVVIQAPRSYRVGAHEGLDPPRRRLQVAIAMCRFAHDEGGEVLAVPLREAVHVCVNAQLQARPLGLERGVPFVVQGDGEAFHRSLPLRRHGAFHALGPGRAGVGLLHVELVFVPDGHAGDGRRQAGQ